MEFILWIIVVYLFISNFYAHRYVIILEQNQEEMLNAIAQIAAGGGLNLRIIRESD